MNNALLELIKEVWGDDAEMVEDILGNIANERRYQKSRAVKDVERGQATTLDEFDKSNSQGDWIAYITRYAVGVHPKLEWSKDDREFEEAMIKVATLAVAAIYARRKGYC